MLGIKQSRLWRTATLNEFRTFFRLSVHRTFDDINSNPQTAAALSRFYGHPNDVEFYPGVLVENATALPPPALGWALFSDSIAVLRGDRFYTQVSACWLSLLTLGLFSCSVDSMGIHRRNLRSLGCGRICDASAFDARIPGLLRIQLGICDVSFYPAG